MNKETVKQIKSELAFLRCQAIKWLVHEADIGCCHEKYIPIENRIKKLKNKLRLRNQR